MSTTTKKVCGAAVTKQTGGKRNTSYGKKTKVGGSYGADMLKESESCKSGEVKNKKGKCVSVASLKGKKIVIAQNYKKLKDVLPNLNKNLLELNKKYDDKMKKLSDLVITVLQTSHTENVNLKNKINEITKSLNDKDKNEIATQTAATPPANPSADPPQTSRKRPRTQGGGMNFPFFDIKELKALKVKVQSMNDLCQTNNNIIAGSLIELLYRIHDEHIGDTIEKEIEKYKGSTIEKRIKHVNELQIKKYKEDKYIDSINEIRGYHRLLGTDPNTIKKKKKILEDYFEFDDEKDDIIKPGVTIPNLMRKMYLTNDDIDLRVKAAMQDVSDITGNRTTFGVLADKSDTGTRMIGKMLNKITPGSRKYKTIKIDTEKT